MLQAAGPDAVRAAPAEASNLAPLRASAGSFPGILRRIRTRLPTCRSVACGDLLTVEKFTCSSCQRHPWFQDPSCYACSCLSCNFASQSSRSGMRSRNNSASRKIRVPSVATRDQTNTAAPKVGQRRSSVGEWAIIDTKLRQTRGPHCSLDASPAGLPTLPEVCRIC